MRYRIPVVALLAAVAVFGYGCVQGKVLTDPANTRSGNQDSTTNNTVSLIVISPSSIGGNDGQNATLTATALNQKGDTVRGATFTWSSDNTQVASVSPNGLVTFVGDGTANISASTASLTVGVPAHGHKNAVRVATIGVTPSTATLNPSNTLQLNATTADSTGNPLKNVSVTWSSSNTSVATVSTSGLLTAVAVGTAVISASSGSVTATMNLTVIAPSPASVASVTVTPSTAITQTGRTTQLTATAKDSAGNVLGGRTISWASSNSNVATVSSGGLVTGVAAGIATISATSGTQQGTAQITVDPIPVASVVLTPASANLSARQTLLVIATPEDAKGNAIGGQTITWTSSNTGVATVNANGVVTVVSTTGIGSTNITASTGGKSASSTIDLIAAPVASVTLSPTSLSLAPGQTSQVTATAKDQYGDVITTDAVSWSSSNTSVATVSSSGLVSAVGSGSATITVTIGGTPATLSVSVAQVSVASVTVSPTTASIQEYATTPLTATVKDASGNVLTGYAVTWSSSNTGIATVSSSGVVTGAGVGSATITATAGGKSGTASVSVSAPSIASVTVSPSTASVAAGGGVQLTATAKDSHGNPVTGQTFTWSSSTTGVASVAPSGYVTGVATGSATITATTGGQSGTSAITVTSSGGGQLASCAAPDLVSWNFPSQSWGPLDSYSFLDGGQVVVDPTAPTGYSARWNWSFNPNADEGGQINAVFPSRQSAYVRWAYKQDPNFPDNGIKKILRFRAAGYNQLLGTLDIDGDKYIWFYDGLDPNTVYYQSSGPTPSQNRGSWHWFEVYNDISQSGNLQFKVWLDGNLIISGTNTSSNQGLSFGIASPGGTFNQPAGVGTDWITDIGVGSNCVSAPW
jgi:uncharacterized protein YjdB